MKLRFIIAKKFGEILIIKTNKGNFMNIYVVSFNTVKLYYKLTNGNKGSIFLKNIDSIKFKNDKMEKIYKREELQLPNNTNDYLNYYRECLKALNNSENNNSEEKLSARIEIFNTIFESLYQQDNDNLLIRYLKGSTEIEKSLSNKAYLLLSNSNQSQKCAIKNAMNYDISIIQGPPGTGKTTTILNLIANLIVEGKKVVVVSKNNSAVNNIIEEFSKMDIPKFYLRIGSDKLMKKELETINQELITIKKGLSNIDTKDDDLYQLQVMKTELEVLETEVAELIELKNSVKELKIKKKFIDKRNNVYGYKYYIEEDEARILCDRNAKPSKIDRLIRYSRKENLNFFETIFIRYKYCLKKDNLKQKLISVIRLLEEYYINKEIADKEEKIVQGNLDEKQKKIKEIYDGYTDLCTKAFKRYLKEKIQIKTDNVSDTRSLKNLAISSFPLVLTTADGFLYNFASKINKGEKVDCIIIDEASQCDVLTGLPLLYMAKKIVVTGDSKQLSAITNINVNTNIPECYKYQDNNFLDSVKNVFHPPETTLKEHYRCSYNIINFCNKYFYDNTLKIYTDFDKDAISIMNVDACKGAEKIKVKQKDGSYKTNIINNREVEAILEAEKNHEHVFAITPFRGQGELLADNYGDDNGGTIHTFQGKGADKVFFSTVLNDLDFCNRHITGKNNMFTSELVNVAVSRAKKNFILVTDKKYFIDNARYVPIIKNLIDYISIYGKEIPDNSSCIFDGLYKNIPYYKPHGKFDSEYEEVLSRSLDKIFEKSHYKFYMKIGLDNLVLDEKFLNENPIIKKFINTDAHADFIVFDTRIDKTVLVIELDSEYHKYEPQKIRDKYKDTALNAVGIPVLRLQSKGAYDSDNKKLKKILSEYLDID